MVRGDDLEMATTDVEKLLEKPVISSIPHDENIRKSVKLSHPVVYSHPNSPSSSSFKNLASLLLGI